jgi:uncharacterized protein involved in exopolysaccharide biosynthesis/Mrp family chromosome partitioning ATPase
MNTPQQRESFSSGFLNMAGVYEVSGDGETAAAEADLRTIARALWKKKALIIGPTLLAAAAALFITGSITPKYRSEARVIVESNDNVYTRPEGTQGGERREADELEIQSQVQLLLSRDLARQVVTDLKLAEMPEFDPGASVSLPKRMMILIGLSRDPMRLNAEERVLDTFYEHLSVYAVPTSRVIVVEFSSSNPQTAADVANRVTERYLELQQTTKQATTRRASTWLASQIEELSGRVATAEAKVEDFRSKSNLFVGTNNATITTQQLGELNSELSRARGQEADARAKAELIQDTLKAGRPVESLDLANSELMRELAQRRVELAGTTARESRTYLPGHPRMKELKAQLDSMDAQIKAEGSKLARAYENEANLAASRVATVQNTINAQKEVAGSAGEQEVQLRALDREAKAQRDLLEQFLARYRDAAARERVDAIPPDARIISRASPSNTPYSPKPLSITLLTAVGTFVLIVVGITASEFMIVPTATGPVPGTPFRASREARGTETVEPPFSEPEPMPDPDAVRARKTNSLMARAAAMLTPRRSFVPDDMPLSSVLTEEPAPASVPASVPAAEKPKDKDDVPVFGRLNVSPASTPPAQQMEIEAADMRMLGELAAHLASMPKGEGALNILTVASSSTVDPGNVALSLARSLAGAGRKAIVVDAGSGSRDFIDALPESSEGGMGELIAGKTSFGQAIQRDRGSAAHLIAPGAPSLLSTGALTRIGIVLDALGLTYDFVIVLSPPTERSADVTTLARRTGAAILVASEQNAVTAAAHRTLLTAGIGDVILLLTDAAPARPVERVS